MLGQTRSTPVDRTLTLAASPIELESSPLICVDLADQLVVRSAMTAAVGDPRSPEAAGRRQEVYSFEQAGLADAVGAQHQMAAGSKRLTQGRQITESPGFESYEHGGWLPLVDGSGPQRRMGMITQTYRLSRPSTGYATHWEFSSLSSRRTRSVSVTLRKLTR